MAQVLPAERDLRRVIGDGDAVPDGEVDGLDGERPARALPLDRPAADVRRALGRLPPAGADRDVRDLLEPRGDAGRLGLRARRRGLDLPELPRVRDRAPARDAGARRCCQWWRGHPSGWWNPADYNVASICVPIATHVPHAAGLAWGKKLRGEPAVAIAYFGDGATSEGAFHEGANFAAVMRRAARPLLQQQPVGDLDAAVRADARRDARRQGGRLRDARRPRRRRRRARRLRGDARGGRACARRRRPDVHRGGHVPRRAARDRRRPARVHRPRARRGGDGRTSASAATSATCGGSACSTDATAAQIARRGGGASMRDRDRRGRGRAARRRRRSCSSTRTSIRRPRSRRPRRSCGGSRWLS